MASSARLAPCTPIRVAKPGEVIAARLQELIVSDVLRPGDRVPPEDALAERPAAAGAAMLKHMRNSTKQRAQNHLRPTRPRRQPCA